MVEGVTSKGDADEGKPSSEIFGAALGKLPGTATEEVSVVGDSPYDAIAASKLSLATVGVLSGGFSDATLHDAGGCIAIFQDPTDLLANYERSPLYPKG